MVDFVKLDDEKKDKKRRKNFTFFSFKGFIIIFLLLFLFTSLISSITYSLSPKIAVVPISGAIMTERTSSLYGYDSISSREIASTLLDLKADTSVKAVLLDINSPGGSPVASEEISKAIESVREEKPVYALINDVGASGAFWIAVSTDKIYASSMSTVGSIGVTSAGLSFENFIKEYNITYRKQTAGEYKDMGSIFREPTEQEEEKIQQILDEIHINFISHVANGRNMSYEDVEPYATGEIFLGSKAKEIGFIDEIGYYPDVIADLKNISTNALVVTYGPQPTFLEVLGIEAMFDWSPSAKSQILLQ